MASLKDVPVTIPTLSGRGENFLIHFLNTDRGHDKAQEGKVCCLPEAVAHQSAEIRL